MTRAIVFLVFLLVACTHVTVRKAGPHDSTPGVRYALPKPFVVVNPQPDGTLDVRVEMLPDSDHTYAVDSASYFATHHLVVKVAGGLLTAVEWTGDSSSVAAEAAKAAGEVAKARDEAQIAAAKAETTRAEASQKAHEDRVVALENAVATARIEVAVAKAEVAALPADALAAPKVAAKQKLAAAEAKLSELENQLDALKSAGSLVSGNVPDATSVGEPARKEVYGAALFQVVDFEKDDHTHLELRGVEMQRPFAIYKVAAASAPSHPGGPTEIKCNSSDLGELSSSTQSERTVSVDKDFDKLGSPIVSDLALKQPLPESRVPVVERINSKTLKLTIPRNHPTGRFELAVALKNSKDELIGEAVVTYRVK